MFGGAVLSCRSLANFKLMRAPLPPGSTIHSCEGCSIKVAVSGEGWQRVRQAFPTGDVTIVCNECSLVLADVIAQTSGVELVSTSHAIKGTIRNEAARELYLRMLSIAEKSKRVVP